MTAVEFKKWESGPPTGADVEVMVKGKYFNELEAITDELKADLAKIPGVTDITDNYTLGKVERGYATVHRFKQERAITLTANVDSAQISAVKVNQMIQEHFNSPHDPGTFPIEIGE